MSSVFWTTGAWTLLLSLNIVSTVSSGGTAVKSPQPKGVGFRSAMVIVGEPATFRAHEFKNKIGCGHGTPDANGAVLGSRNK